MDCGGVGRGGGGVGQNKSPGVVRVIVWRTLWRQSI